MGRRKKREVPALPSSPVRLADALLFIEPEIRQTVNEERKALSLIGHSNPDGNAGGRGRTYSDRTAAAAVKLADGLPCIVLDDGRTVHKPEKWLAVFDAVREKAKTLERPRLIFDIWRAWYRSETIFIDYEIEIPQARACKNWIRYNVLIEARKADLVTFEEEEVIQDIEAAEDWTICD